MNCPSCNSEIRDGAKYCPSCGANTMPVSGDKKEKAVPAGRALKESVMGIIWIPFLILAIGSALSVYYYYYKPNSDYKKGEYHYRVGEYEKCIDKLEKVVSKRPKMDRAWVILSECYLESGKKKDAEDVVRQALRWNKKSPGLLSLLGRYYYEDNKFKNAEKALRAVLAKEPANRTANQYMGMILFKNRDYKESLSYFGKSLKGAAAVDRIAIRSAAGDVYYKQKNLPCAEKLYKAALADNINNVDVSLNLINIYLQQGKFDESKDEIDRVVMIDPESKKLRRKKNEVYSFVQQRWLIEYILSRKQLDNYIISTYSAIEDYVNRLNAKPSAFLKKQNDPELAQMYDDAQGILKSYQKLKPPPESYMIHTETMTILSDMEDTLHSLQTYTASGEQEAYEQAANQLFSLKKNMKQLIDMWAAENKKMNIDKILKNEKPADKTKKNQIPTGCIE